MRAEDYGLDLETGVHSRQLTKAEEDMMEILSDHIGKAERISAHDLALQFYEAREGRRVTHAEYRQGIEPWKRDVRHMTNHLLIDHDQRICSKAGTAGGYWLAQTKQEMDEFYETFRKRAMTGLVKASRGKRSIMADMVKQIAFEFEELKTDRRTRAIDVPPLGPDPAPEIVVTEFLNKMTREPEKYTEEIKRLRRKFGQVFMDPAIYTRLRTLSGELTRLLGKAN
jgi:hypothetical protein